MAEPIRLPFFGGAYAGRSEPVNAERCLNFYLEKKNDGWILVGTPGLTLRTTLSRGPVRGAWFFNDRVIWVAGNGVYQMGPSHTATLIGTIGTATGRVSMADNGSYVMIVDGSAGYYTDGGTVTAIADVDFVGGTMVAFQDGYFIVIEPDTQRLRISDLYSVTNWVDTDFSSAEGLPDKLRAIISDHRELWLGGVRTFEVFYNSGDADFPFVRTSSGYIEKGIAAGFTLAKHDNSLVWLSEDDRGHGLAVSVDGNYRPTVVSPAGINWQWSRYSVISDAFSFTYQIEGHEFYVITFPTGNATWVLDASTKQWHQWSSNLDNNPLSRHRANCHVFAFDRHYVGDYASGKIYSIESDVYTEDGASIIRDRIGQHISANEERIPVSSVQILFEEGVGLVTGQGSNPQAMLRWSKSGGRNWSNEVWRSVGAIGEFLMRAVWRKLGRSYRWSFWLRVSDPIKWIVRDGAMNLREDDK